MKRLGLKDEIINNFMDLAAYKKNKASTQCEALLFALTLTMVFEGILRKLVPTLATPIFFFKDVLCILGLFIINRLRFQDVVARLNSTWLTLFFLFVPLLFFTAFKDVLLAVFAAKQYLLYLITAILITVAFPGNKHGQFRRFIFFACLLLLPTTMVAAMQNALPPTHWLNLSVGGDSLERFSAAGYLRVSSTFSFTGQYSWFLNAEAFLLATSFFLPPVFKSRLWKIASPFLYILLGLSLMTGAFITGGRSAVIGCGATLALGFVLIGINRPSWFFSKGLLMIGLCITGITILKTVKPEFVMAYSQRSSGTEETSHEEEIASRMAGGFTDWAGWFWDQDTEAVLVGNGLGIMSNGSSQISPYASEIRSGGFWTEGDVPSTFWEGGIYLAVIWYGFRIYIILLCFRLWNSIKDKELRSAAGVPMAYVVIHGLIAQFGIQPPLSIWWWLAIGIILFLYRFEKYQTFLPVALPEHKKI